MGNHHFLWVNPLFRWPFSIAMLVYQRVSYPIVSSYVSLAYPLPALESLLLQVRNQLQSPSPLLSLARWSETAGGWAACNSRQQNATYIQCINFVYIYVRIYIYIFVTYTMHTSYILYIFCTYKSWKTSTKLYARLGSSQDAPDTIHRSGRIGLDFSLSLRTSWFNQFDQQELHSCHVGSSSWTHRILFNPWISQLSLSLSTLCKIKN